MEELLSLQEAAKILNINRTTLYRWSKAGKITIYKIVGKSVVKKADVENILNDLKPLYP